MVDLKGQYLKIQDEIDHAIQHVISSCQYIKGPAVHSFEEGLSTYLGVKNTISCANGTDALQIALMALDLKPGDEVIVPAFTYVATAEVIALLGLTPIMVDVDQHTFCVSADHIKPFITPKTKAIVPVHLFGQCCDMDGIMQLANEHNIFVIEDNAQAIGCDVQFDGKTIKAGTIGHIGTTSFFPSKNLGCYGDGGAIFTNDDALADKVKMIANHGQSKKYYHDIVGCNSRLDSIQAAVLNVKLKYLDQYNAARKEGARNYNKILAPLKDLTVPYCSSKSDHIFHQYTIKLNGIERQPLMEHLSKKKISSAIYYPLPLYKQKAYDHYYPTGFSLPITEQLCQQVFSLPIHSELTEDTQIMIGDVISEYIMKHAKV